MPRKSSSDNIVRLPGRRPPPPDKLTASEQRIWKALVDSAPGGFYNEAAQLLLRHVVAQVGIADRHAQRLRQLAASGGPLEMEIVIEKAHRDAVKGMIVGMTALRATPSRMSS
jgi:hypothetical protein